MRAPKVVDFYTAAWPDFTPALTESPFETIFVWRALSHQRDFRVKRSLTENFLCEISMGCRF